MRIATGQSAPGGLGGEGPAEAASSAPRSHPFRRAREWFAARPRAVELLRAAIVVVAYFAAARGGLALASANSSVTAVWPPTGIALAAVLIWGYRVWPAVWIGAFLANVATTSQLGTDLGIATGNTLEALCGAYLLTRVGFRPSLERIRDVIALAVLAAVVSTTVSATIGVLSIWAGGSVSEGALASTWRVWWLGDMGGDLLVAPLLLVLSCRPRLEGGAWRIVEAAALAAALAAVGALIFLPEPPVIYPFIAFPLLFWAGLRFRQLGAVLAGLLASGVALWFTARGRGPLAGGSQDAELLRAQLFAGVATVTALLVAGVRTAWERAEEALAKLAESERKLTEAQAAAEIGSWEWDIVADEVTWSPELYRIYGLDESGFGASYAGFLERVHPDDREDVERAVRRAFEERSSFRFQHRIVRPGGEVRTLQALGRVVCDERDQPVIMGGTGQDITNANLAEAERLLAAIVESSEDAIVGKTLDGVISTWNRGAERLYGYSAAEVVGKPVSILTVPDRPDEVAEILARIRRGEHVEHHETVRRTKDGRIVDVWLSVSPVRDAEGRITGASAISRDITQRKRAEADLLRVSAELERRVRELAAANRELEAFGYSASHDLRTPLRAMDGFSRALLEDYGAELDEEGRRMLERVRAGSQRMGQLLDEMLELSKITRQQLRHTPVDLSASAREILGELEAEYPEREIEWVVHDGLVVEGDPELLRVALTNLLENAWKFTEDSESPHIEFDVEKVNGDRSFVVRDNGAGFDMAYAEKLFRPFERLHREDEYAGTGVGLATVQRIVRRHAGEIWAEGEVGHGAAFHFSLGNGHG